MSGTNTRPALSTVAVTALVDQHGPSHVRPGAHDWTRRNDAALLRARTEEPLRWRALDRAGSEPTG